MQASQSFASGSVNVPDEARDYLIRTHSALKSTEQAKHLGKSVSTVEKWRGRLYEADLLRMEDRAGRRVWTAERVERARGLIAMGQTPHEAARALGNSYYSMQRALRKHGGQTIAELKTGYTVQDAAHALGICSTTVKLLLEAKLLRGRRYGGKRRSGGRWHIERPALVDFVRERRAWMVYEARFIRDEDLRTLALAARKSQPGEWVRFVDLSHEMGLARHTVGRWYAKGVWPGDGWDVAVWGITYFLWVPPHTAIPGQPAKRDPWIKRRANQKEAA